MILVMASLPSAPIKSAEVPVLLEWEDKVLDLLVDGMTRAQIAKKIAPNNSKKRKLIRRRILNALMKPAVAEEYGSRLRASMLGDLGSASLALGRKARAGRVDAVKLLFESTGFYNPRLSQVEHSGEVQITIKGLPRPTPVEDKYLDVPDADVIED